MELDQNRRLLLRAAFAEGEQAIGAYKSWRSRVPLDDIDFGAVRILGQVVQTATRYGIDDADISRIRGAVKHTWLSNMLRTRALGAALRSLEAHGIEVMILKGAALFARYPELAKLHLGADFDILIRPRDAITAIDAVMDAGFRMHPDFPADPLQAGDLERLHAFQLEYETHGGSIDVHWWPLPRWPHYRYVEELFARSETASVAGHQVRLPSLADHMFLTLVRPEAWETDEIFPRAVEATHLLRCSRGVLDWKLVVALCRRLHHGAMAGAMLALLKSELEIPVADDVVSELRRATSPLSALEFSIGRNPDARRTPRERFLMTLIALARLHPKASSSILRALPDGRRTPRKRFLKRLIAPVGSRPKISSSTLRRLTALGLSPRFHGAFAGGYREMLAQSSAGRLWRNFAKRKHRFDDSGPNYVTGFSYPESQGRWTDGYSAVVALPAGSAAGGRVQIRLTVVPLLSAENRQTIFEMCAGRGLETRWVLGLEDPFPAEIVTDAEVIDTPGFRGVVVAINLKNPARPHDLGLSDDSRLLGLFIKNVERLEPGAFESPSARDAP